MKKLLLTALAIIFAINVYAEQPAKKQKTDYSKIHGVCYTGWRSDEATVRQQLGYGQRIGINSTRIWMGPSQWERNPEGFIKTLKNYIAICNSMGYTVMPILSRSGYRYLNSGSIYEAGGEPFCTAGLRQISTSKQYYGVSGKNGGVDLIEGASVVPVSLSVPRIYMGYSPEGRVFYYSQEKGYSWLEGRYYSFAVSPGIWDGETLTLALNPLGNGRKPVIWRNGTIIFHSFFN